MKRMAFKKLEKIEKEGEMNRKVVSITLAVLLAGLVALPGCGVSQAELDEYKALVAEQSDTIEEQAAQIQSQNTTIEEKTAQIEALKTEIVELENERAEDSEAPKDPTYMELLEFMREDETEKMWYEDYPMHDMLARIFLENAREKGIRGYSVTILIGEGQIWYFTGFETTDKGWIYILPAIDREVKLEVGKRYHVLNDFSPFGVDDTILKITIHN